VKRESSDDFNPFCVWYEESVIRISNFSAKSKILGNSEGDEYLARMCLLVFLAFVRWGLKPLVACHNPITVFDTRGPLQDMFLYAPLIRSKRKY
jgi:hypothetical protein